MTGSKLKFKGLGHVSKQNYDNPDPAILEAFPSPFASKKHNPHDVIGTIHIEAPEFTTLCPITGQPDFATIVIDYEPDQLCVESKSLKLYLGAFRQFPEFHEGSVARIANDLIELLKPLALRVEGRYTPRGGIPFWPVADYVRPEAKRAGKKH
jgi:7-cyano-7-deazaguanine reductase